MKHPVYTQNMRQGRLAYGKRICLLGILFVGCCLFGLARPAAAQDPSEDDLGRIDEGLGRSSARASLDEDASATLPSLEGQPRQDAEPPNPFAGAASPTQIWTRWQMMARHLDELRDQYQANIESKARLIQTLDERKKDYDPKAMDPASLLRRREIESLFGQFHELTQSDRQLAHEASMLMHLIRRNVARWKPVLEEHKQSGNALSLEEGQRLEAWLDGARMLEANERSGFFSALLGPDFGDAVAQVPLRPFRQGRGQRMGPEHGPGMGMHSEAMASNPPAEEDEGLLERLERIQNRQDDLVRILERQQREIERLRQIVSQQQESAEPSRQLQHVN